MIRSILAKPFARYVVQQQQKWSENAPQAQKNVFEYLIQGAKNTLFGKDHDFENIHNYADFQERVPIRDYEGLRPYVEKIQKGETDILWKDKPLYFAKTSGTTSGTKYIPITRESMPFHIQSARNALLCYVNETGKSRFLDRKLIFLSGSPEIEQVNGIYTGRLSGIVNHHVPNYLRSNQMPSYQTNCIEDWELKLDTIIKETLREDMSLISGIPPWVQMYFDRIQEKTGKKINDVFPNFSLFVHGGVNFQPYSTKLYESIGQKIDSIETYPASEGFIAYQNSQEDEGLLMLLNHGIFYEFVPADQFFDENPPRLTIEEVETDVNYAVIMSTNAGLWGYSIGDTVRFVQKNPYKLRVSGRIKHFISAFGEHVIGEEVERALRKAVSEFPETEVIEFTVAPQVTPSEGLPHHEWLMAFATPPHNLEGFKKILDTTLCNLNSYYDDLITGSILKPLEIISLPPDAFINYMKSKGKLGGQNKVPRLSNDRKIADEVRKFLT